MDEFVIVLTIPNFFGEKSKILGVFGLKVLALTSSILPKVLPVTNNYGKDKNFNQIADLPVSYSFAEDIESPVVAKLPLWILGFLY